MWGAKESIVDDFEEVVEEVRLELREEQVQSVRNQWVGEGGDVFIGDGSYG